ncbi:MAG: hypothetical protein M3Y07_10165 [Acidobacteriota bacterium]|nr:hypothetical protein [Acidobacteriota bacterium]
MTNVTSSTDGNRSPYAKLSNPFPDGFNTASNGAGGLLTNLGQSLNGIFRGDRTPYTAQWNFDLQYELPSGMLLDTAYAGNAGIKQLAQTQLNQLPDRDLALGDQLTQVVGNPFFGVIPATSSIGKATTTYGQLLRPFPQFTGVQQTWGSLAHSSYHSLQIKFRKRYTNGLQLLAAYTWSKLLDDYSSVAGFLGEVNPGYIDNNDRRTSKSLSAGDVAHRLVLNYEYELPFGAGKRFLNAKGFLNAVAGGWNLNGITTIQSGLPIQVTERNDTTNSFGGAQLPDSTGKSSKTPGSPKDRIDNYFDKTAFADPPKYAFGNTARLLPDNRGPYLIDFDLSVLKRFPIAEKKRLEFRAEFFNMLNNVNFANPTGNATVFGRPQFGTLTAAENARIVQLGLKLYF